MTGNLYIVATPIGNMEDITYRAIRILSEVDVILCEDTRHTIKLLNHYNIKKPLFAYHSYNEKKMLTKVINMLKNNKNLALVSDSGTPCISDPGTILVSYASKNAINIIPIPGASALLTLLSVGGMPTNPFQFIGFLSTKKNKRRKKLSELLTYKGIIILYESPHRILKLIEEIVEIYPQNNIVIARELTKRFEETYRGTGIELYKQKDIIKLKGEYTILIDNTL